MAAVLVNREKFSLLMGQIVQNEFSSAQRQIYKFEGDEIIKELFDQKNIDLGTTRDKFRGKAFALTEYAEAAKLSIDCINMVVACFTFYLAYSHAKSEERKEQREKETELSNALEAKKKRLQLLGELKQEMGYQQMPDDVIEKITEKYQAGLIELVDEL